MPGRFGSPARGFSRPGSLLSTCATRRGEAPTAHVSGPALRTLTRVIHLRSPHTSLLLVAEDDGLPILVHWGARLPPDEQVDALLSATAPPIPHSGADVAIRWRLAPMPCDGWPLRPALEGSRGDGTAYSPRFTLLEYSGTSTEAVVSAADPGAGLRLNIVLRLHADGVLTWDATLTNTGDSPYRLQRLSAALPVPAQATEVLDLTGRWCRERIPQRAPLRDGAWVRDGRRGRTGHDAPTVLVLGTPGFGFRHGEVFGMHVGWSGNTTWYVECSPFGVTQLGGGELLEPGEVNLAPGEQYDAPTVYFVRRGDGLDGISEAFHRYLRSRPQHPARPRPVLLNTWEAVYFDHRLDTLTELADVAASIGVERYVLDDGWFGARRDDTAGLGDWTVSTDVWPDGLGPLIDHVTGLGMEFGLWVEPEMVNPDSDLYRAHPDWILHVPGRTPLTWRQQQVLDLGREEVSTYLLERLDALLTEYDIAYLKWDHNRDLTDTGHLGTAGVRRQTLALYRMLDSLRNRHPGVEIESCASGGGRVDLGILARTDRVWASDCSDPLERQAIQRWTGLLLPPELIGAHVASAHSHTTGRTHTLGFRVATALFGHLGLELDLTVLSDEERGHLREAIAVHQRFRPLLHAGTTVRLDTVPSGSLAHGVVAPDRSEALFAYVQLTSLATHSPGRLRLAGLDPERPYRAEVVTLAGGPSAHDIAGPAWIRAGGVRLTGATLMTVGIQLPVLHPEQALVIHLS